jgi:Right handed beta helix region
MRQKEIDMPANSREGKRPMLVAISVAVIAGVLAVTATFAFGQGPLALLSKAGKSRSGKVRSGSVGQAIRVTRSRYFRHHYRDHDGGTPTTPPPSEPAPTPDTTPPQTSITSGPTSKTTSTGASFGFSSSESSSSFECKLDAGGWASCATPKAYSSLGVGSHQFSVRAIDAAKNVDATPATRGWTVEAVVTPPPADTTPPQTSITSGPPTTTTSSSASFGFSSSESSSSFECKLDANGWAACTSPEDYSGVSVGSHQFSVRAIDAAKNVDATPATQSWTVEEAVTPPPVDTTPPQTSITSGPPATTTSSSASFGFSSSESSSSFECKVDAGSWTGCLTPKAYSAVTDGSHQFSVRATDAAKNVDPTPATQSWTVEEEVVAPPPPLPSEGCTSTVSSVSAVQSTVSSASPGAVICLADGSYGKLTLSATKSAPGVTVRADHPGQATIAGASMSGARLTLARFKVTDEVTIQPGATAMVVDHNRITGGYMGVNAGPTSTTQINDTVITNNKFVGPFGEDAIRLNRYHDSNGDGIGVLIEGNEISGVRENGNHSDCLQAVWVGDHIVYRKNYLHDNRCQGFFIKDQASLGGVSGPIEGITVEDNLFVRNNEPCAPPASGCGQPSYFQVFGPYSGFTMRRNTFWTGDQVAVFQEGTGSDTKIESNVIYRLWTNTNMSGVTYTNNTRCKRETTSGGSWPSSTPGETVDCAPVFNNPATDDLRLAGSSRGIDWAPAEQHYGP